MADFIDRLKSAEAGAQEAGRLLEKFAATPESELRTQLDAAFDALGKVCTSCHRAYRDPAGIKSRN